MAMAPIRPDFLLLVLPRCFCMMAPSAWPFADGMSGCSAAEEAWLLEAFSAKSAPSDWVCRFDKAGINDPVITMQASPREKAEQLLHLVEMRHSPRTRGRCSAVTGDHSSCQ